jgi:hypothetical protein
MNVTRLLLSLELASGSSSVVILTQKESHHSSDQHTRPTHHIQTLFCLILPLITIKPFLLFTADCVVPCDALKFLGRFYCCDQVLSYLSATCSGSISKTRLTSSHIICPRPTLLYTGYPPLQCKLPSLCLQNQKRNCSQVHAGSQEFTF